MHTITARLLYDLSRDINPEGGYYVWVDPNEVSILTLQLLIKDAPFKIKDSTEFHATVLYHKGELPKGLQMPQDRPCRGRVTHLNVWDTPKGSTIVAAMESPDLQKVHQELLATGLTHTFDPFIPHVTLGTKIQMNDEIQKWVTKLNVILAKHKCIIGFDPALKGSGLE